METRYSVFVSYVDEDSGAYKKALKDGVGIKPVQSLEAKKVAKAFLDSGVTAVYVLDYTNHSIAVFT